MARARSTRLAEATWEDVWQVLAEARDQLGIEIELHMRVAIAGRQLVIEAQSLWVDSKGKHQEVYVKSFCSATSLTLAQETFRTCTMCFHKLDFALTRDSGWIKHV